MGSPELPSEAKGIPHSPRSPLRAALFSGFAPGTGQIYNKQLEKAVLIWIWFVILVLVGIGLLLLGLLGKLLPASVTAPPLSPFVRAHAGMIVLAWFAAWIVLWFLNVRDAWASARGINRGEIIIRHPMRWQLVHVLGSQLLGFIPLVGFLFPPGIVAEAVDSYREKRKMKSEKVLQEGGMAVVQWIVVRAAFYAVWIVAGTWVLWWILRAVGWVPW